MMPTCLPLLSLSRRPFTSSTQLMGVSVPFLFKYAVDILTGSSVDQVPLALAALTPTTLMVAYGVSRATQSAMNEGRNALFADVTQSTIRRVSREAFAHLHRMDLSFHLARRTGSVSKAIDRGTRGISFVLGAMVFNVVPTAFEVTLVAAILAHKVTAGRCRVTLLLR